MSRFEGSYLGDAGKIGATTRLECKVCWYVYDPVAGDAVWQIAPGTPFADLPEHWSCPNCAGDRTQFMVLDEARSSSFKGEAGRGMGSGSDPDPDPDLIPTPTLPLKGRGQLGDCVARLETAFREIHAHRMRGLPFINEALRVEAVGFRRWEGRWLGVLITPWFMNLVLLPDAPHQWRSLTVRAGTSYAFPAGVFDFIGGFEPAIGEFQSCSLFSPVFEFEQHEVARATAEAALGALFDAGARAGLEGPGGARTEQAAPPIAATPLSKRDFLRGRRQADAT